jgi:hypothetical protein
MPNYLVWHDHEEVEPPVIGVESDGNEHDDRMDEMLADNWTHKSCLWELPYAKALIPPHNIDLMHQEHNVAESIISMCLDVTGFSKDNMNARKDLATLCDRPSLEVKINVKGNLTRPQATYCLKPAERKEILKWLKKLMFLDRYAANIK